MGGGGRLEEEGGLAEDCLDVKEKGACLPLPYVLDTRYSRRWDERPDLKVDLSIKCTVSYKVDLALDIT